MIFLCAFLLLFMFVGMPVLLVWLGSHLGMLARFLAKRQQKPPAYPVAEMLESTFEPEPENVWPPSSTFGGTIEIMSITEIKTEISHLPLTELADLARWIEELQADAWDRQIARDVKAGRFNAIFRRVDEQAESGQCRPL